VSPRHVHSNQSFIAKPPKRSGACVPPFFFTLFCFEAILDEPLNLSANQPHHHQQATMPTAIGINGFGRIGRLVMRAALDNPDGEWTTHNHEQGSWWYLVPSSSNASMTRLRMMPPKITGAVFVDHSSV